MASIAVAALGLGAYAVAAYTSWLAALILGIVLVVLLVPFVAAGTFFRHNNPTLSSYLLQGWSLLTLLVAAGFVAVAIYIGTELVLPEKPTDRQKGINAGAVALVTVAGTKLTEWFTQKLSPWFAYTVLRGEYLRLFPSMPSGSGPTREAYDLVAARCNSFSADQWTRAAVEELMKKVQAARKQG